MAIRNIRLEKDEILKTIATVELNPSGKNTNFNRRYDRNNV